MTPTPPEHEPTPLEKRALLLLLAAVSAAMVWILLPFYGTILWGTILALLFAPLYRRLLPRLKQQAHTRRAADFAGACCCWWCCPALLIGIALAREASSMYEQLESGAMDPAKYFRGVFDALPAGITTLARPLRPR